MFVTVLMASTLGKIFQPFFDAMAWVIAAFYALIPNYAIAIALLTLVVMAVTAPLTVKSTRSMMAMSKLQPQMKKLQEKYKGDKVKLNEEMMKLYRENNVSPAAGCVPMLIQFPVFIILYDVIRGLTNTVAKGALLASGHRCRSTVCSEPRYIGHSTALYRNLVNHPGVMKAFGINLADDVFSHGLSLADRVPLIVMILIAVGMQYFQMHQMNKRNAANGTLNQQMQAMTKFMPLVFMVIYIRIAAGVNVYFIVSNLCRIGLQMWSFRTMPAQAEIRVGRLGAPASGKPRRRTLMERLADAQQRALEQQAQQRGTTSQALTSGRRPGDAATGGAPKRSRPPEAANGSAAGRQRQGRAGPGQGGGAAAGGTGRRPGSRGSGDGTGTGARKPPAGRPGPKGPSGQTGPGGGTGKGSSGSSTPNGRPDKGPSGPASGGAPGSDDDKKMRKAH